jgi:preprotein translocase subunit SecA
MDLLKQDLLMHYLLRVPQYEDADLRPTSVQDAQDVAVEAARRAFAAKLASLDEVRDETGIGYGDRLLSLVMLNVLDEKWKDHLYDLDQLRNSIHYRSWGQTDPLIEYKQEAYSMFVDLMDDIYNTFGERFLKVQLMMQPQAPPPAPAPAAAPRKRYNAMGILETVPEESPAQAPASGTDEVVDVAPDEPPAKDVVAKRDAVIVGAGGPRTLEPRGGPPAGPVDWSTVGRNDPCPCGSGKKFKKCHGAQL